MSAGLNVSAKGRYLAAPEPVETMCQAETREKCGSPAGISGTGPPGGAVHAENRVGIETRLAKLGNDVVGPLVHRAVEEDVDVLGRGRRDAGELQHVADRHMSHLHGDAQAGERGDVAGALIPHLAALQHPKVGWRAPGRRFVDLFEVVDDRSPVAGQPHRRCPPGLPRTRWAGGRAPPAG